MRNRVLLLPILLLAAAIPLAGCGGGDGDEDEIADVIETAATTNDPETCTELQTQRFTEQVEFETGEAAVEQCKSSGPESNADSVEVSNVEVEGDTATADAAISGAAFDGQTLTISLVKVDGQWKLDRLVRFVDFDQQALATSLSAATRQGPEPASAEQASCIEQEIATAPAGSVEQAILSGDDQQLVSLFGSCFQ